MNARKVERAFSRSIFPEDVERAKARVASMKAYKAIGYFEPITDYYQQLLTSHFMLTAKALTGRCVTIEWAHIILGKSIVQGLAVKQQGGAAGIYLKTGMGWLQSYKTFLHECGHISIEWENLWDINDRRIHNSLPVAIDFSSKAVIARMKPREDRVDKQAAEWFTWAHENCPYSQIVRLLVALEDWKE